MNEDWIADRTVDTDPDAERGATAAEALTSVLESARAAVLHKIIKRCRLENDQAAALAQLAQRWTPDDVVRWGQLFDLGGGLYA